MHNTKTKKIIFLLPMLGGGGGERVVSDLSFGLPENIEKVMVVFENKEYFPYKGRVISLSIALSTNFISKIFIFFKSYVKFRKIIATEKPDYIISFGSLQNIINVLSFKKSIVRIDNPIAISHQGFFERVYPLFVRILFNRAYKIIVVSRGLEQELVEKFKIKKEKINVILNSINIEHIRKAATEKLEPEFKEIFSHRVIINIGSLIGQKGQANLIKAFKEVKQAEKDVKLVILGEGILEGSLKDLVKKEGLESDVYFLGWQKNPFKFLARSKLFVLSSLWEGFGIVLLEAMACRVPIISSDCSFGPREILSKNSDAGHTINEIEYGEYGVLLPDLNNFSDDERKKLISKAIVAVLNDTSLQRRIVTRALVRVKDFTGKKIKDQYKFLQGNIAKTVDWVFLDKRSGGSAYNTQARSVLSEKYQVKNILIKNKLELKYVKPVEWMWQMLTLKIGGDIVVQESFDTLVFPILKNGIKKVAIIHHLDNSIFPFFTKPFLFIAEKLFDRNIKKCDMVVVVSEYWKQYFLKKGCKNVHTIYNGFDVNDFAVTDKEVKQFKKRFNLEGKKIIYIGNCQEAKGVVESFEALKDMDVFLVTSGEKKITIPARNLDLDYKDYLCLLKASSLVVAMSKFKEGWCRTVHEAMLCKTPVIGSGLGGMKELLEGGKQMICHDVNELTEKVEYLLRTQKVRDRMGKDGFAYAKQFTKEKFAKEWIKLFDTIV